LGPARLARLVTDEPTAPPHPPVEGPEESLEPQREEAHEALAARVAELEARERDLVDRLQRLAADFENHRRRAREEGTAAAARGKEQLLRALLPALDSLDRALAHASDEGLKLLARQLQDALASQGVRAVRPEGEAFDARRHEAVAEEAREGAKPATVLAVLDAGYELDGKVVRPARVVVAK
jgi:molecular chaperone GrpE